MSSRMPVRGVQRHGSKGGSSINGKYIRGDGGGYQVGGGKDARFKGERFNGGRGKGGNAFGAWAKGGAGCKSEGVMLRH
jgi:hypothetical protein